MWYTKAEAIDAMSHALTDGMSNTYWRSRITQQQAVDEMRDWLRSLPDDYLIQGHEYRQVQAVALNRRY